MRVKKRSGSAYSGIVIGVVQAIIISVMIAALGAVFIDNESVSVGAIPVICFIAWFLSSFMCAIYSGRKGDGRWVLHSAIATLIYYILIMSIGIFIFDGLSGAAISGLIAGVLGFVLAIILLIKKKKRLINRKLPKIAFR